MHDPVRYILWVGCVGLIVVVCCFTYVVWINAGSRNLALGLGALVGACVIFALQLIFEMRGSQTTTDFVVEFTIDFGTRTVRSTKSYLPPTLAGNYLSSLVVEDAASKLLQQKNSFPSSDDAPKIARDLAVLSSISFFLSDLPDWQLDAARYRTVIGTMSQWSRLSIPSECTRITLEDIVAKLKAADNMFATIAQAGLMKDFCAPPGYVLEVASNSVVLRGLVSVITITFNEPFSSLSHFDPRQVAQALATQTPIAASTELLSDGSPRYSNVTTTARLVVRYAAYRAQQRDLSKYQIWATRVAEGLSSRFGLAQSP